MAASSAPAQASTWTEPPWSGWIETTGDALLILEAARRGLIPRVTRRLVDSERKMITSGSVFVFDEDESGIKRWTDGFFWSPSRILGNFLLYRETDKRGAGHRGARSDPPIVDTSDQSQYNPEGVKVEGQTLSRPKGEIGQAGVDRHRERTLMGSLTNSYKFKPEGLMKKTFSLNIGGVAQHLISYYKIEDVENGRLRCPSSLPELASLDISPEYLDKTHFRNPPKVEIGLDGQPRYRGEADIEDGSPTMLSAPLQSGVPLLKSANESSSSRRVKRYDPYGSGGTTPKRSRKNKTIIMDTQNLAESSADVSKSTSPPEEVSSPLIPASQLQPHDNSPQHSPVYADSDPPVMGQVQFASYSAPSYYPMSAYPSQQLYPPTLYSRPATGVSPTTPTPPQQSPRHSPIVPAQSPQNYSAYVYTPASGQVAMPASAENQQPYQYPYYPPSPAQGYSTYTPSATWPYPGYPPQQPAAGPVASDIEKPHLQKGETLGDIDNGQS